MSFSLYSVSCDSKKCSRDTAGALRNKRDMNKVEVEKKWWKTSK